MLFCKLTMNFKVIFTVSVVLFLLHCGYNNCVQIESEVYSVNNIDNKKLDIYLDSIMLMDKYNYAPENHTVTTEDGYILNLFRIPRYGPPVLLAHGIADSSDSWLVLGPKDSLAYLLADYGFDVWLFNARGNKYSTGHVIEDLPPKRYWNFSYEELGYYDLPAVIDYILLKTSFDKLSYVGFSQGSTIFIVMCSMKPDYNTKIKQSVLLAPVAWINRLKHPLIEVLTRNLEALTMLAQTIGLYKVFSPNSKLNLYHATVCRAGTPYKILCDIEYYLSYNLRNPQNLPKDRLPVIASHIPAGTSAKTFIHFMQGYANKKFQRFDYGYQKNFKYYASLRPPEFDISKIIVPTTIFVSETDWTSNVIDVDLLRNKLPNVKSYIVLNKSLDFTHIEFTYGTRVKKFINKPVINILSQNNI